MFHQPKMSIISAAAGVKVQVRASRRKKPRMFARLVWMTGLEPATSWSLTRCATNCATSRSAFVIELGLEPKTHSLEGCCSIQLSYSTGPNRSRSILDFPCRSGTDCKDSHFFSIARVCRGFFALAPPPYSPAGAEGRMKCVMTALTMYRAERVQAMPS